MVCWIIIGFNDKINFINYFLGDLDCVSEQLEKLIPATTMHNRINDVFNEFRLLLSYVKSLGVNRKITFVPLLS